MSVAASAAPANAHGSDIRTNIPNPPPMIAPAESAAHSGNEPTKLKLAFFHSQKKSPTPRQHMLIAANIRRIENWNGLTIAALYFPAMR